MAHATARRVLVDGAQAVSHMRVDVQALDCDFFVFSGHKVFGPTGIGVRLRQAGRARATAALAGRRQHDRRRHLREDASINGPPERFEAGTGNIADAVGLGAAIDYVEAIGMDDDRPLRARAARLRHRAMLDACPA